MTSPLPPALDKAFENAAPGEPVRSGTGATLSAVIGGAGLVRVTGLSGVVAADIGLQLVLVGAAHVANVGPHPIRETPGTDTVLVEAPRMQLPDPNNGVMAWAVRRPFSVTAALQQVPTADFTNTTRPAASTFARGTMIWNIDDNAPNYSDGTAWRDALGNLT